MGLAAELGLLLGLLEVISGPLADHIGLPDSTFPLHALGQQVFRIPVWPLLSYSWDCPLRTRHLSAPHQEYPKSKSLAARRPSLALTVEPCSVMIPLVNQHIRHPHDTHP